MKTAFWGKVLGDLRSMSGRLILLGFAVGIGVLVLSAITGTASTLLREMDRSYEDTVPATATLEFKEPVDADWAESLIGKYGIIDSRAGGTFQARFQDGNGQWQPIVLFVVPDLVKNRIAIVRQQNNSPWPPRVGGIALERTAFPAFKLTQGQSLQLIFSDGTMRAVPLETMIHDPGVATAYQERTAYAYVDAATARFFELEPYHQLKVRFNQSLTWKQAKAGALDLAMELQKTGMTVSRIEVPPVHKHPHQSIITSLLIILGAFGVLTILLCSLLVSNTVNAMIAKEKKWIGVMKTLGASPLRIMILTMAPVAALGILAVSWTVPLGICASKSMSIAIANLLNITIKDTSSQWWAIFIPLSTGFLLPLVITLFPARKALKITILEALSDVGTEHSRFTTEPGPLARFLAQRNPVLALAWRNALRKKSRLILSILLLGIGGGLFITAFNLGTSWKNALAASLAARKMDFQIRLVATPSTDLTHRLADAVPEIQALETWRSIPVTTACDGNIPVEATYPDEAHGSFRAFSMSDDTAMFAFPLLHGRWAPGKGEVVLNQSAALRFPNARTGDSITLLIGGKRRQLTLVGIVKEFGQAAAYLEKNAITEFSTSKNYRTELLVKLYSSSQKDDAKKNIEKWMIQNKLPVEVLIDNREFTIAGSKHFELLISLILILGMVTGLVGWLGIASILGLAVTERRKEFGIIRCIGGTPQSILRGIIAEAGVMTVLGAVTAVIISLPISAGLGAFLGNLTAKSPLSLSVNIPMVGLWLALSLPAGMMASLGAGFRAARIPVRETLQYL